MFTGSGTSDLHRENLDVEQLKPDASSIFSSGPQFATYGRVRALQQLPLVFP